LPLAAVLGLGALWMSYRRRALAGAGPGAVLAGGLLAIAGVVALTLKDPGQPRYLIPAIAVAAVLLPLALRVLLAGRERVLGPLALTVMVIAVGVAVVQVSHLMRERAHEQRTHERLVAAAVGRGCLLVPVDKSSAPPYALAFGNAMSSGRFATALQAMYPGFVYYSLYDFRESPFHPGFSSWGGTIGLDQVRAASEGRPLCLASQYDLTATTDLPIDEIALGGPRESFHAERLFVMAAP
jgi:hypothetical protein